MGQSVLQSDKAAAVCHLCWIGVAPHSAETLIQTFLDVQDMVKTLSNRSSTVRPLM